jgi:hypothetical protein
MAAQAKAGPDTTDHLAPTPNSDVDMHTSPRKSMYDNDGNGAGLEPTRRGSSTAGFDWDCGGPGRQIVKRVGLGDNDTDGHYEHIEQWRCPGRAANSVSDRHAFVQRATAQQDDAFLTAPTVDSIESTPADAQRLRLRNAVCDARVLPPRRVLWRMDDESLPAHHSQTFRRTCMQKACRTLCATRQGFSISYPCASRVEFGSRRIGDARRASAATLRATACCTGDGTASRIEVHSTSHRTSDGAAHRRAFPAMGL